MAHDLNAVWASIPNSTRTFAARAAAEFERLRAEEPLRERGAGGRDRHDPALSPDACTPTENSRVLELSCNSPGGEATGPDLEQIIGRSPALRDVLEQVARVAPTDATVLVIGETGTGKELIARAVHAASRRNDRPFIKVNCAALPAGLVESELFGHEKGAFTGASARRHGRFELADGGTLFLDEIGELPAEAQVKLLRVLQEREFDRVGGTAPIRVDVRVIAATNRDLLQEVKDRAFRSDLYYRLNVFPVRLPPLRERQDDIPLLVRFLVNKFALRIGKRLDSVTPGTMERFQAYPWPGNVRELENVLERAVILATGPTLDLATDFLDRTPPTTPGDKAIPVAVAPVPGQPLPRLDAVVRDYIVAVLRHTRGVITGPRGAAQVLGLKPSTLRSRIKKLGISRSAGETA